MQQLNNTSALQGQQHKRLPSRLFVALFFLLPLVGWGQHPFTLTTPDDVTNGTEALYWIESFGATGFYMIPKTSSNNSQVSTSNMPNAIMLWYFMDAGIESGTQYYYIVNKSTSRYLCHTGNLGDNNNIKIVNKTDANDASCKFSITGSSGQWLISPKSGSTYYVNKKGSNVNYTNGLKSSTANDANSKWNFVAKNSVTWAHPFTNSTNSEKHYYYIHNAPSNGSAFYMSTDDASDPYATVSNVDNGKRIWYFMEAASDNTIPNLKYYYIVNAITGKYLKFTGTANGSLQANSLQLYVHDGTETGETENRFQFMVLNAIGTTYSAYSIMPKLEISNYNDKFTSLSPGNADGNTYSGSGSITLSNDMKIGIYKDRGQDNNYAHWNIETANVEVEAPEITYDNVNQEINITCGTEGASIYYTLDGSTPTSSSTPYNGPVSCTSPCTIKAIAVKSVFLSDVTTYELQKVATPTFSLNTNTNEVTITSTTGASIYYSIGAGNTPSIGVNPYTAPFEFPYAQSNQPLKAIAVKEGWINSDMGQQTFMLNCYMPTFSFNNSTQQVTLSCEDTEATMYYTTNGTTPVPGQSGTTQYTGTPFGVTTGGTVKAIAVHTPNYNNSNVAELTIAQVATPTIQNNGSNAVSITCATEGATIYYEINGTPVVGSSPIYSEPLRDGVSGQTIRAIAVKENMINSAMGYGTVTLQCEGVSIHRSGEGFVITCAFPSTGATLYYETAPGSGTPAMPTSTSPSALSGAHIAWAYANFPVTVTAIATAANYFNSAPVTTYLSQDLPGSGTQNDPYLITQQGDVALFVDKANDPNEAGAYYQVTSTDPLNFGSADPITVPFSGHFDGGFCTLTNLSHALFNTVNGGFVHNVILKDVTINGSGNIGAICNEATGTSRIYNCGILPTTTVRNAQGDITGFTGSSIGTSAGSCGSLVGLLDGTARVINCFSYANITSGGGSDYYVGGLVGNNSQSSDQNNLKTIVVNCMFYGDIDTDYCSNYAPVYGNNSINNDATTGINPYDYFRENAEFDNHLSGIASYKRSWSAKEEYLTRFEYYRSILNSNRQLMAWWVSGNIADTALIAKWVLDPEIAPYPVLKKWGKYPSIINPDPSRTWDPVANNGAGAWQSRSSAAPYRGKSIGTLNVTVKTGDHPGDEGMTGISVINDKSWPLTITDMDTLDHDYGYYKVQLPYYNEVFGDPSETDHIKRYYGNYTNKVVTGWKITSITGGVAGVTNSTGTDANGMDYDHTFTKNWETGYNFADRYCTNKDLYSVSDRVFAQGGFFYVPEGVTAITIEAYWGKAVYLHNKGHYLDRVNITNKSGNRTVGDPFSPTGMGTLVATFQGQTVWDAWHTAVTKLDVATVSGSGDNQKLSLSVYDQAIVLLSNYQLKNENGAVGYDIESKWHPYTMMSVDLDMDNEPDYCFEFQFRNGWNRPGIQPIRFDFLPVPELGLAVRHSDKQHTIGIFIPQGHFEITETSYMHTTQFEYDFGGTKIPAPVILNGGHFEQIVVRRGTNQRTSYFIMGGHFRMQRFTPGAHTTPDGSIRTRHCAVNAIGGEYPEFYLSGIYKPDQPVNSDNPHCYTNGGRFGTIAGAGYEAIDGDITFKIDHSIIDEFYGGGINRAKPVTGSIDVTIDHSIVGKYCGGPKVGEMTSGKTVTTYATETTFTKFYGGGNGGTSYYRKQGYDGNDFNVPTPSDSTGWANFGGSQGYTNYDRFNPLNTRTGSSPIVAVYDNTIGYHALYEFECFVSSNGLDEKPTLRTYTHWAQFGKTSTGNITTFLDDCTVKKSFYGGGNLGNVDGTVTSTLKDCTIMENVFGGGYSSNIEPFRIHDKSQTHFPYIDDAGVMQNGSNGLNSLEYLKNADGTDRYYTWCYKNSSGQMFPQGVVIPDWANTSTGRKATFEYPEGSNNWYVLTKVSLEGLGEVSSNVELNLTGNTTVGHYEGGNLVGGNVFGGGDMSAVNGNATVTIKDSAQVRQNVFGGGNAASVGVNTTGTPGNTTVKLQLGAHVLGNVYGGGNEGVVGGDSQVIIQNESGTTPEP